MKAPTKAKTTESPKLEEQKENTLELFPIRLTHNYRPVNAAEAKILDPVLGDDGEVDHYDERVLEGFPEKKNEDGKVKQCASREYASVVANTVLMVPKDEARRLLRLGRAQRHDDL
jgi:hypothetical protein